MVKSKVKNSGSDRVYLGVIYTSIVIFLMIMLYPFIITISTSISDNKELVAAGSVYFLPVGFSMKAYNLLLHTPNILRYYGNTILYAVSGTILMLVVSCMTAYPLSHRKLPGRRALTVLFTITLFISGGLVPSYIWLRTIGLIDNIWTMIIPGALNVWNIIIFKSFFEQLPPDIREAAYIDGANDMSILFRMVIPLSKPIIATFAVFGLVGVWNDFFTALMFLKDPDLQPMQLYLRGLLIGMDTKIMQTGAGIGEFSDFVDGRTVRSAAVVITVLPIACVYPFFQKYFTNGIMVGSIKG